MHDTTRRDRAAGVVEGDAGAARRHAVASERLVARYRAAAAGRAGRPGRSPTALKDVAESAPDWRTRLHALWTLDGLDAIDASTVTQGARRLVARRARRPRCNSRSAGSVSRAIADSGRGVEALDDPDWAVRHQLAATLARCRQERRRARRRARDCSSASATIR